MVTGRTNTLGAVVADVENVFFARVLRGFTDVGRAAGFEIIVANTDERPAREEASLAMFIRNRVDGVLVSPASMSRVAHLFSAHGSGLPLVLLDRHVDGLSVDAVVVDNVSAARGAVQRLLDGGHRRIAMVAGTGGDPSGADAGVADVATTADRVTGYRTALEAAGLPLRRDYVCAADYRRESARAAALTLLALPEPPTAVFTSDSLLALGVLQAVRAAGLSVPRDLSLVSFDNPPWSDALEPPLTVVDQPAYEMGAVAARRLVRRVQGDTLPAETIRLDSAWVERGSIASPPTLDAFRPGV
jgi:LacI family transcriptional regulator